MLSKKKVAVVVSAYNEEIQIKKVIDSMPKFVDKIVIINDGSTDNTEKVIRKYIKNKKVHDIIYEKQREIELLPSAEIVNKNTKRDKVILINHKENSGKGSAICTGYKWCVMNEMDCVATMDGDGQMDPKELEAICLPIVTDEADYSKGNRLSHSSAYSVMPKTRFFGNSILSLLTKIASGYWKVSDTQTGFTAISLDALRSIPIHKIYKDYGYPNDVLVKLNISYAKITEVPIKPLYNVGEESKMKIYKIIPKVSWLLMKAFIVRLYVKYLYKDFHPLFMFYNFGIFLLISSIPFAIKVISAIPQGSALAWQYFAFFGLLLVSGVQFVFFGMWMDMMDNERLYK